MLSFLSVLSVSEMEPVQAWICRELLMRLIEAKLGAALEGRRARREYQLLERS